MNPEDERRPLVGEHPYLGAAREHRHPAPTGDPQTVGDLDRLQLAERALADALAAARGRLEASLAEHLDAMITKHRSNVPELVRLIRELGGAPSDHGPNEMPQPSDEIARLILPAALAAALADDARSLVRLYRVALDRLRDGNGTYATLASFLTTAQLDADRLGRPSG
jgi:hypothetical protein